MSAKLVHVIEAQETIGRGVEDDPWRTITVYYSLEGERLAENDHGYANEQRRARQRVNSDAAKASVPSGVSPDA